MENDNWGKELVLFMFEEPDNDVNYYCIGYRKDLDRIKKDILYIYDSGFAVDDVICHEEHVFSTMTDWEEKGFDYIFLGMQCDNFVFKGERYKFIKVKEVNNVSIKKKEI